MMLEIWPANSSVHWRLVTDAVMGGVSRGSIANETLDGRKAIRMRGEVSTVNNGGFLQITLDFDPTADSFDASSFTGLEIDVRGNNQNYGAHLRTAELSRPQQSYRQGFMTTPMWQTIQLPFVQFSPHRTEHPLNTTRLRRIGLVAIGREFAVDLSVARLALY
ncbi:MAG: CIA30 family protein [Bradyrhizobium sp.]|jgi:hypothetical protein